MKIENVPFGVIEWSGVPQTQHPGESGVALWRTAAVGNVRVRMVEYSAGYRADHWCSRGHVVLVLEGEIVTEVKGQPAQTLQTGMSYVVSDDIAPHRSSTAGGARLFIID